MSNRMRATMLVATILCGLSVTTEARGQSRERETPKSVRFVLKSGEKTSGTVNAESPRLVRISTPLGERVIATETIAERADATANLSTYERRARVLQDSDLPAREALAAWCREEGLIGPYCAEVEKIMLQDPDRPSVRRWAAEDRGRYEIVKNLEPSDKPRWAREQSDLLFAAAGDAGLAKAALIRAELEALAEDVWLGDACKLTKDASASRRFVATGLLAKTKDTRRTKPLYVRALTDAKPFVRRAAVHALMLTDDGTTIRPFVRVLEKNDNPAVRIFAAEALGEIGDRAAVEPLVRALEDAGQRRVAHQVIAVREQVAYVKDFDVEIAQSAFIADPVVDIAQEGVVLDAGLISVNMEKRVISRSLTRIVGPNLGPDASAWRSHLKSAAK